MMAMARSNTNQLEAEVPPSTGGASVIVVNVHWTLNSFSTLTFYMVTFCDHLGVLVVSCCLLWSGCGDSREDVWLALVMVRGADITCLPHEPLDTLERLVLLGMASPSLRVTGVVNPRGPSPLCYAVTDGALVISSVSDVIQGTLICTSLKSTLILSMVWS